MRNIDIRSLISKGEGEQLDFKQTIHSAQKISKTLSAFANTRGGLLLVGIKDNGLPAKINVLEEQHVLEVAAGFYCKPPVAVNFTTDHFHNHTILLAEIQPGVEKPYYAKGMDNKWWAYIRVHDQCLLASKVMVDVLRSSVTNVPASITFGTAEKILLQYLEKHTRVTLKEFCKAANIARWRAQKILVNLVRMGIIKVISTEKSDYYSF